MLPFRNLSALLFLPVLLFITNCSTEKRQAVQPPFQNFDVAYSVFDIDPAKGGEINYETGSRIIIPPNAFVDMNGNPVTVPVRIKYREIHTSADVIASGITMRYDSGGTTHNFVTAGMFEIEGFAQGLPVQIANGKEVQVQMASYQEENNFNFYFLDKEEGNWQYRGTTAPEENVRKQELLENTTDQPIAPIEPRKAEAGGNYLDLNVPYERYPELKPFRNILWEYAGNDPATDPRQNPHVFSERWINTELKPLKDEPGLYQLTLQSAKKKFTTTVRPVLGKMDYEQAVKEYEKLQQEFTTAVEERQQELDFLARQGDVVRSFGINNFGVYNWDRLYQNPMLVQIKADFKLPAEIDKKHVRIFHISGKESPAVISYTHSMWNSFMIDPNEHNRLIAVLPQDKVAILKPSDIQKIGKDKLKAGASYTFDLQPADTKITSAEELNKLIGSL